MSTVVAVKYATIYYASHENNTLIPKYQKQMVYYLRFIDDIFTLWLSGRYRREELQQDLSFGKMIWTVERPKKETKFLDWKSLFMILKISLTKLAYEKYRNLHNYLPTNSSQPPGTFKSLVVGFYWLMNSSTNDCINQKTKFVDRVNKRGYSFEAMHRAFSEASFLLQQKIKFRKVFVRAQHDNTSNQNKNNKKSLIFKRTYHP